MATSGSLNAFDEYVLSDPAAARRAYRVPASIPAALASTTFLEGGQSRPRRRRPRGDRHREPRHRDGCASPGRIPSHEPAYGRADRHVGDRADVRHGRSRRRRPRWLERPPAGACGSAAHHEPVRHARARADRRGRRRHRAGGRRGGRHLETARSAVSRNASIGLPATCAARRALADRRRQRLGPRTQRSR